jgi:hypothetical protein
MKILGGNVMKNSSAFSSSTTSPLLTVGEPTVVYKLLRTILSFKININSLLERYY